MFEGIQKSLSDAFKKLRGRGRLTEANIHDGMREVRRALLEADVNFNVVNTFIQRVTERSVAYSRSTLKARSSSSTIADRSAASRAISASSSPTIK